MSLYPPVASSRLDIRSGMEATDPGDRPYKNISGHIKKMERLTVTLPGCTSSAAGVAKSP